MGMGTACSRPAELGSDEGEQMQSGKENERDTTRVPEGENEGDHTDSRRDVEIYGYNPVPVVVVNPRQLVNEAWGITITAEYSDEIRRMAERIEVLDDRTLNLESHVKVQ
jgi:hypothetical protein